MVLVFAGPNGSGKSTIVKSYDIAGLYINADDIKKKPLLAS
jgi:predicted ABC-type ATPase